MSDLRRFYDMNDDERYEYLVSQKNWAGLMMLKRITVPWYKDERLCGIDRIVILYLSEISSMSTTMYVIYIMRKYHKVNLRDIDFDVILDYTIDRMINYEEDADGMRWMLNLYNYDGLVDDVAMMLHPYYVVDGYFAGLVTMQRIVSSIASDYEPNVERLFADAVHGVAAIYHKYDLSDAHVRLYWLDRFAKMLPELIEHECYCIIGKLREHGVISSDALIEYLDEDRDELVWIIDKDITDDHIVYFCSSGWVNHVRHVLLISDLDRSKMLIASAYCDDDVKRVQLFNLIGIEHLDDVIGLPDRISHRFEKTTTLGGALTLQR